MKKKFFRIFFLTIILFHLIDITIGKYLYKKFIRGKVFSVESAIEKNYFYDHSLKKNFDGLAKWGDKVYSFCTDHNGFKIKCADKNSKLEADNVLKKYDIAFLGDSFTEGVGYKAEDTFVGLISNQMKQKKIVNLSVQSYSPKIYFSKIKHLLNQGFYFKEVIIFLDLSDLADDNLCYELSEDIIVRKKSFKNCYDNFNKKKKNRFIKFYNNNFYFSNLLFSKLDLIYKFLIKENKYYDVFDLSRSQWSYEYNEKHYNNQKIEDSLNNSLYPMVMLSDLLKKNLIDLSVAVYPHPATLKHDKIDNLYVNFWKSFCINRCKNFFNFNESFFKIFKVNFYKSYSKFYIEGDFHFSQEGHKLIANQFLKLYKE